LRRIDRWTAAAGLFASRHPWWVLVVSLLASAAGVLGLFHLRVDRDLKALLPPDAPSVTRLEDLSRRIGAQSDFIVEITSPDRRANIAFGDALAARMSRMPELRYVIFHREMTYFEKNALLYLPLPDLLQLRRKVIDRIRREVARATTSQLDDEAAPTGPASRPTTTREELLPELDARELAKKLFAEAEVPGEYMEVDEGRLMVIKARPVRPTTDLGFATTLVEKVRRCIDELGPTRFHPRLVSHVRGEYWDRVNDVSTVSTGVYSATAFTTLLLLTVIVIYFRRLRAVLIVLVPVVVGTLITQGLGVVIYRGTFNIVTTFIFAILMGLGIDYAIHCLARYRFERQRGLDLLAAMEAALRSAGSALLACALTTGSGFFLLQLAHFRGFSQFGLLAGIGLLIALVVTFIMVPALIVLMERLRPMGWKPSPRASTGEAPSSPDTRPRRGWQTLVALSIVTVSLVAAVLGLVRIRHIPFEYDFTKLGERPPPPPPGPPRPAEPRRPDFEDAIGSVTTFAPAVAMCDSEAQCEEITRLFEVIRRLSDDETMKRFREGKTATAPRRAPDDDDESPPLSSSPDPLDRLEAELSGGGLLPDERERVAGLGLDRLEEMRHFLRAHIGKHSFVPPHQALKLQILADVRRRIDAKRGLLDDETNRQIDRWYSKLDLREPVTAERIPRWAMRQLEQVDGARGRFVILWNIGSKANYNDSKRLYEAFFDLPVPSGQVKVAANYFVLVEVMDTLKADGPIVLTAAAITIFLVLLIHFRSFWSTLIVLMPLLTSLVWLAGLYLLLDWKLNLFSVLAFALLTGMGIDNGIHVFHRWHDLPSVRGVLREAGGPITLSTFTNFIGFAGLMFASHQGIQSLGLTASIGIWLALVASLATLPALFYAIDALRARS
jgi:uncharacterized protein